MELIDNLLKYLQIEDKDEQKILRLKILAYSFERASAKLSGQINSDEKSVIQSYYSHPVAEDEEKIKTIFSKPQYQDVLIQSVLEVIGELLDDPNIVKPEERDNILNSLESSLS